MGPWWLYLLVFIFGYLTHKTFYFFRSMRTSIGLIRISQLVSLNIMARSMEHYYYAHTAKIRQLTENDEDQETIRQSRRAFSKEMSSLKEKSIKQVVDMHPRFFSPTVNFTDWKSAMKYLDDHRNVVDFLLDEEQTQ
jgi:hypothetical protein|tara:strand:- start:351 stop:761 length:411 start_codon:yes stop_codon:yes gene_type:complete